MLPRFNNIILASASPRRRELLDQIGVKYQTLVHRVDETPMAAEDPQDYVCRLALAKAESVAVEWRDIPVLGADTIVTSGTQILGKPENRDDAIRMLQTLSGRTHVVYSAVAICLGDEHAVKMSTTKVTFRALSADECLRYWQTGEPEGKAGAYAIQGLAAMFVTNMEGSYSGVVGLPVYETCQLLEHFEVRTAMSDIEADFDSISQGNS